MDIAHHINHFKLKLQAAGALRPEAWEQCVVQLKVVNINTQNSCLVPSGAIAYVAEGILKEYDTQHRNSPSILNFLAPGQLFYSYASPNRIYTKATIPSIVFLMDRATLLNLVHEFSELDKIFLALYSQYDELRLLKIQLLEMPVQQRVETFSATFHTILPYLKKKDMANYLHLNYTHFLKKWNSL